MENQSKYVVHFRFDQADLDVAAVDFVKIQHKNMETSTIVPNCIAITEIESQSNFSDINMNSDEFLVFVSSYFTDQLLFSLSSEFGDDAEFPPEKR
jgi:hypothetical protein